MRHLPRERVVAPTVPVDSCVSGAWNPLLRVEPPRAIFDVRTGLVQAGPSFPPGIHLLDAVRATAPLKTFPVHVEGDEVYVTV